MNFALNKCWHNNNETQTGTTGSWHLTDLARNDVASSNFDSVEQDPVKKYT